MKVSIGIFGVLGLSLLTGCSNIALRNAQEAYRIGDLATATMQIDNFVAKEGRGVDCVIAHIEQGTIRREAGDIVGSSASFAVADAKVDEYDDKPDVSLSKEGIAAVTNMNSLPYRGYNYDRIMLSTYLAINHMHMGNREAARVELQRAYQRQVDAVDRNAKRIEKSEEAAKEANEELKKKGKQTYDIDRAKDEPKFKGMMDKNYSDLDKYSAYANYVNPFTEWLHGIFYLSEKVDGADTESGRKLIERVKGMVNNNAYVDADFELAQAMANGAAMPATTYVIFATGTAPKRGQIRIDIPLFLVAKSVDYVGANFPKLVMNDNYMSQLIVHATGQSYPTQLLADMDGVVAQEFKNELPMIITKTLIAAGTKAVIAYALKQATKDQGWAGLVVSISSTIYQIATNEADLRTWASLPKQFQYARLATPENRQIQIAGPDQSENVIELIPGTVNFVMVRSINPATPFVVSQFSLGKGAKQWVNEPAKLSMQP